MRTIRRHGIIIVVMALLAALTSTTDAKPLAEKEPYLLDRWTTADGLPVNGINAVLISRSGYLWLATFDGLVRFDGHRFTTFSSSDYPSLASNRLIDVDETPDGRIWLLSEQGYLTSFDGHTFQDNGLEHDPDRPRVHAIHIDEHGKLWAATHAGLMYLDGNRLLPFSDQESGEAIVAMAWPSDRRMIMATARRVVEFIDGERARSWSRHDGLPSEAVKSLAWDERLQQLWVGTDGPTVRIANGRIEPETGYANILRIEQIGETMALAAARTSYRRHPGGTDDIHDHPLHPANGRETLLRRGPDGALWRNRIDAIERNGEPVADLPCTLKDFDIDSSGAVWIATSCDGLWRLRARQVQMITELDGNRLGSVYGLAQAPNGELWVATLDNGVAIHSPNGRTRWLKGANGFVGSSLRTLLIEPDGTTWVGQPGLCRMSGEHCVATAALPIELESPYAQVRAVHRAADGSLWVGALRGLFQHHPEHGWRSELAAAGLTASQLTQVRTIAEADDGNLWFGTHSAGLIGRDPNGDYRVFGIDDGLSSLSIRNLRLDQDGNLWIATEDRGLCRLQDEAIACIDRRHGLPTDSLHQILIDRHDRLWLNSNNGVFQAPRRAFSDVLDGLGSRLHPQVYTERDGLAGREGNGGVHDAGIVLDDGRLAFPGQKGVAIFDPDALPEIGDAPRAVFESVVLPDGRRLSADRTTTLPVADRSFTLHYTGLSSMLTAPVYFRYRLRPDTAWIDLGDTRQLHLSRLPPGRHDIELQAFNSAGEVSPAAPITIVLPPFFHETTGFRALLAGLLIVTLLAWFAYRRQVSNARQRWLQRTVAERTSELRDALEALGNQRNEIEHLAQSKARFFAGVSHELRTPLTLLLGPLDDYARGRVPPSDVIDSMARSANRLKQLIDQLLDLERIDAGRMPVRSTPLDLIKIAEDVANTLTPLASYQNVQVEQQHPPHRIPVTGDGELLQRLLTNLLSNAIKFTRPGSTIRLCLLSEERQAVVQVDDAGPGIPPAWRQRIFDRFAQLDQPGAGHRQGSGLGLSLCQEIARLHGGSLTVDDSPLGGARFEFRMPHAHSPTVAADRPAAPRPATSQPVPDAPAASPGHDNGTRPTPETRCVPDLPAGAGHARSSLPSEQRQIVLVAEDDPDLRGYIASLLRDRFQVVMASDGVEAMALLTRTPADLIVTDLMMPNLDGFGLASAVRAVPELAGTPIIFLTARASDADRIKGLDAGADHYLCKPFTSDVLLAHIEASLRTCQRLRDHFRQAISTAPPVDPLPHATGADFESRFRHLLASRSHDPDWDVATMASQLHMSEATLRRRCQHDLQAAPGELLREHRLSRARQLLLASAGNVSEVAYAVGYGSLSAFTRAYRDRFGHPPSRTVAQTQPPPATDRLPD